MAYKWNKIINLWLWFPPNGVLIFPPKGSHQPTLLPKGGHRLVCRERFSLYHSSLVPSWWCLGCSLPLLLKQVLRGQLPYRDSGKHFLQMRWSPCPQGWYQLFPNLSFLLKWSQLICTTFPLLSNQVGWLDWSIQPWHGGGGSFSGFLDKACVLPNQSVLHSKPRGGNHGVSPLRDRSKWWEVVTHVSWAPAESQSTLPMSVGVSLGHWLIVPGSILPKPG